MILETLTYSKCSLLPVKLMFMALDEPTWQKLEDNRCSGYSSVAGGSELGLVCCAKVMKPPCRACLPLMSSPTALRKGHGVVHVLRGVDTLLPRAPPDVSQAASACVLSATFCAFPMVAALPLASYLAKQMVDQNRLVGMGQVPAERRLGHCLCLSPSDKKLLAGGCH